MMALTDDAKRDGDHALQQLNEGSRRQVGIGAARIATGMRVADVTSYRFSERSIAFA